MGKKNEGRTSNVKSVTKVSSKGNKAREQVEKDHKRLVGKESSSPSSSFPSPGEAGGSKSRRRRSSGGGGGGDSGTPKGNNTISKKSSSSSSTSAASTSSPSPSSSMKKGHPKVKNCSTTIRPTLASVHETSTETEDGTRSSSKEMNEGKCLETDRVHSGGGDGAAGATASAGIATPPCHPTETVDEIKSCPIYFGVRSYLHHFYETVNNPNTPSTEEDFLYLIHPKGRKCGAVWFKIGLIIGATLFLLGAIAIVIGYAIPKQDVIVGRNDEFEVVDKDAVRFNKNLDICKLIGLAGFCSGGLVLVVSLLAPTFTSTYWEDDPATEPFRVSLSSSLLYESEPKSPIPVTEKIKCIQPIWNE